MFLLLLLISFILILSNLYLEVEESDGIVCILGFELYIPVVIEFLSPIVSGVIAGLIVSMLLSKEDKKCSECSKN